jgi:hypothetical protein
MNAADLDRRRQSAVLGPAPNCAWIAAEQRGEQAAPIEPQRMRRNLRCQAREMGDAALAF